MYERTSEAHARILRRDAEERGHNDDGSEQPKLQHVVVKVTVGANNTSGHHVIFSDGREFDGREWSRVNKRSGYGRRVLERMKGGQ